MYVDQSGIENCNREIEQNNTSNNADLKRLDLSGDLTKNFNLYSYIYSHEGISWESFATVLLSPVGVPARRNNI